jgi:hypothetical protein
MKGAEKKQKTSPAIMVNTYSAIRYGQNENGVTRKQLRQIVSKRPSRATP